MAGSRYLLPLLAHCQHCGVRRRVQRLQLVSYVGATANASAFMGIFENETAFAAGVICLGLSPVAMVLAYSSLSEQPITPVYGPSRHLLRREYVVQIGARIDVVKLAALNQRTPHRASMMRPSPPAKR